jgi:hypothetical protein
VEVKPRLGFDSRQTPLIQPCQGLLVVLAIILLIFLTNTGCLYDNASPNE